MNHYFDYLKLTVLRVLNINLGNKIKLAGYTVHFGSIKQLKLLFKEIFVKANYECELGETPYIIDGGANIGLAVLYFKMKYPNSRIIAFEPNIGSFECLKKNVSDNKLSNVEIYHSALSDSEGEIKFYTSSDMETADIGASAIKNHVDFYHSGKGKLIEVKVIGKTLSTFIDKKVDLLKLDIEGSEEKVFNEIKNKFHFIENTIMEYHYQFLNGNNQLSSILRILENNNHIYKVDLIGKSKDLNKVRGYMLKSKKG